MLENVDYIRLPTSVNLVHRYVSTKFEAS